MFKKIIFTSAMLVSTLSAHASGSVPFGVTGTITPAACDVTLTGGVVNLGVVSSPVIRTNAIAFTSYVLPSVIVPFTVTCSAPSRVEVSFIDNHPGKNFPINGNDPVRFGLVDGTGTVAIGAYQASFTNILIDGSAVGTYLTAPNGTTTWSGITLSGLPGWFAAPGYTVGFGKAAGATTPDALTTLNGSLIIDIFLSTAYVQNATNTITPNGSGTMTLVYL